MSKLKQWFGPQPKSSMKRIDMAKRFDLINRTGQGSMSKVWKARDKAIGRTVCLKILDKVKTAKFEARFPGAKKPPEGEICVGLRHKNVVRTLEFGISFQGEPFLVMELIEGDGLNLLVETRSQRLDGNRINYLSQISNALEYLHGQGFIHRDVCPRNVMVDRENVVKLIDFGLTIPNKPIFCKPGNRTGTPMYMPPELIRRLTTDHRVDLFALGVTAYEMFTHGLPWERGASVEMLAKHMNMSARNPRELNPKLDEATVRFLLKAVARDPNDRFQSAAEFRDALENLPRKY
jgi:serine/threonine protein kinase